MKSPKQHGWKWQIALMILVAWIGLDGMVMITQAQVQPPHRKGPVMVSPNDTQKKDETAVDIGTPLVEIAQCASNQSMNQMVDLAFVIDWSVPMVGPVRMVEKSLADMARTFEESGIDYQFTLILFQNVGGKSQITVKPLRRIAIENYFVNVFKGNVAGYGLDAIMEGVLKLKFRLKAEKHLVVVTNSNLRTAWEVGRTAGEIVQKRNSEVQRILKWSKLDQIRINVIGISEDIQMQLADSTGGKWYRISKGRRKVNRASRIDNSVKNRSAHQLDGIFKGIAQHIAATVKQPADIVFVFDASLSMDDKVEDICTGLEVLVRILDSEGLDYRFGVIRFWARADGGKSTIITTKPPLNIEQIKNLFRLRRHGDENLLDAIMEGVPKLQTPDGRKLVLVITTDELASRGPRTEYTYTQVVEICRDAGAQVNMIGAPRLPGKFVPDSIRVPPSEFMLNITESTNGRHYIMPGTEKRVLNPRYK